MGDTNLTPFPRCTTWHSQNTRNNKSLCRNNFFKEKKVSKDESEREVKYPSSSTVTLGPLSFLPLPLPLYLLPFFFLPSSALGNLSGGRKFVFEMPMMESRPLPWKAKISDTSLPTDLNSFFFSSYFSFSGLFTTTHTSVIL